MDSSNDNIIDSLDKPVILSLLNMYLVRYEMFLESLEERLIIERYKTTWSEYDSDDSIDHIDSLIGGFIERYSIESSMTVYEVCKCCKLNTTKYDHLVTIMGNLAVEISQFYCNDISIDIPVIQFSFNMHHDLLMFRTKYNINLLDSNVEESVYTLDDDNLHIPGNLGRSNQVHSILITLN